MTCQHVWGIDGMHSNEYCKRCFISKETVEAADKARRAERLRDAAPKLLAALKQVPLPASQRCPEVLKYRLFDWYHRVYRPVIEEIDGISRG